MYRQIFHFSLSHLRQVCPGFRVIGSSLFVAAVFSVAAAFQATDAWANPTAQAMQAQQAQQQAQQAEQLKSMMEDIVEPAAISWWPLAWGWWLVIAIATTALFGLIVAAVIRHRNNLYRRQAIKLLSAQKFENFHAQAQFLMGLSKQVALKAYPKSRSTIAKAFGPDWLNWLNGTTSRPMFNKKLAQTWQEQLYTKTDDAPSPDLTRLIRNWIRRHQRGREVLRDV